MAQVLTLASFEDLLLGDGAQEIADVLAGRSEECFTARVINLGPYEPATFYTLVFKNRELFQRFGQLSEKGKIQFARGIYTLIEQNKPKSEKTDCCTEIGFRWSIAKLRRLRVSRSHEHIIFDRFTRDDTVLNIELI